MYINVNKALIFPDRAANINRSHATENYDHAALAKTNQLTFLLKLENTVRKKAIQYSSAGHLYYGGPYTVNRTHHIPKYLYNTLFLLSTFGPDYCCSLAIIRIRIRKRAIRTAVAVPL